MYTVSVTNHFKKPIVVNGTTILPSKNGYIHVSINDKYNQIFSEGRVIQNTVPDKFPTLHVGGITSRWTEIDATYQGGVNTSQGVPWLRIHNLTAQPLHLDPDIFVEPFSVLMYYGEKISGIRLGTIFRDKHNMFEDFIYSKPCTDIYFGTQTLRQVREWGGLQRSLDQFNPNIEGEPVHLLEDGWY